MDYGIKGAISSDILPIGPRVGIYAAVTRKGMTGAIYGVEEAITREEAIRAYTATGAYLNFEEDIKGTLESGKFAEMIVLSKEIMTITEEEIMDIDVSQTYVDGK
jgi:Predicted metal-dependent hydrolase with the TIM-barrel fold